MNKSEPLKFSIYTDRCQSFEVVKLKAEFNHFIIFTNDVESCTLILDVL